MLQCMSLFLADFVVKVAGGIGIFRQDGFLALCAGLLQAERRHRRLRLMVTTSRKTRLTGDSRNARGWGDRGRPCDQFCEPAKVLGDRRQRELELGTARPAQPQAAEPQDALQMCEQHLNTLPVTA